MTPRSFALGTLPIYGRGTSSTPRVLALHGWARTHRDFDWLLADPAFTAAGVLALDLPGFGETPLPDSSWGTPQYADALAEALRSKDMGPAVVLGHSFGGKVGVRLAAQHPDVVSGLVLTGVPLLRERGGPAATPPLAFRVARALNRAGVLPDTAMEKQRQKHGSADYRTAGPLLRPVLVRSVNEDYDADLGVIAAQGKPVGLVWGDGDTAAPAAQVQTLRQRLAPVVVSVGQGQGHDTVAKMRGELADAVRAVLAEVGAA